MNRYGIFRGPVYYPNGGMQDLHSSHPTLEEANVVALDFKEDPDYSLNEWGFCRYNLSWLYIYDFEKGEKVFGCTLDEAMEENANCQYMKLYGIERYRFGLKKEPLPRYLNEEYVRNRG